MGVAKKLLDLAVKAAREAEAAPLAARSARKAAPKVAPKVAPKAARLPLKSAPTSDPSTLDMSYAARMARAKQMGFDVDNPLHVSTLGDTPSFAEYGKFGGHKGISGISLTDNPLLASRYLDRYGDADYKNEPFSKQMMKVYIRPGNLQEYAEPISSSTRLGAPLPENYSWPASLQDIDTAVFSDAVSSRGGVKHVSPGTSRSVQGREFILRDPSRIRSFSAAFDPEHSESPDIMKARGGLAVKPVWDKKRPKDLGEPDSLSVKRKAAAKRRAKAAGRPYPNLVDNMAAARKKGK